MIKSFADVFRDDMTRYERGYEINGEEFPRLATAAPPLLSIYRHFRRSHEYGRKDENQYKCLPSSTDDAPWPRSQNMIIGWKRQREMGNKEGEKGEKGRREGGIRKERWGE